MILYRKTLRYEWVISSRFVTFLVEQDRYKMYELDITISSNLGDFDSQMKIFDELIEKLGENFKHLRFRQIIFSFNHNEKEKFYNFIDKYDYVLRPSCINYLSSVPETVCKQWYIWSSTQQPLFVFPVSSKQSFQQYLIDKFGAIEIFTHHKGKSHLKE